MAKQKKKKKTAAYAQTKRMISPKDSRIKKPQLNPNLAAKLAKQKAGRVTFMPIDVVSEKRRTAPNSDDAIPLLSKLRYDPKLSAIMSRVFGKTLVCRDRFAAMKHSKNNWRCAP